MKTPALIILILFFSIFLFWGRTTIINYNNIKKNHKTGPEIVLKDSF